MNIELWLAMIVASIALLAIPGPVVMMLFGYTASFGRSVGGVAILGVVAGGFTAMTVSLLGAGAILAASPTLFFALKLAGAAYLIWLGIQTWRSETELEAAVIADTSARKLAVLRGSFLVTALNPKDIIFFVAFLPQFITPNKPTWPQIAVIEITFLTLVVISTLIWMLLAGTLVRHLKHSGRLQILNRIGGVFLVAAGMLTGLTH
ncbi:MAG: LysE family translocator [Paracoccaceae bacterium]|uniref:LysE family translocator n=1 Tax=Shimia thalassica TaxID=1715693 RepID=UPI0032992ACE